MKKKIASLLVFALLLTLSATAISIGDISSPTLSEMSDQELMSFLAANDVSVPPELAENPHFSTVLRSIVAEVENDPHKQFLYSYTVMLTFAQEVQSAVNRYYNIDFASVLFSINTPFATAIEQLQQNTALVSNWAPAYRQYNCYSYVLARNTKKYNPGDFYNDTMPAGNRFYFNCTLSIDAMASTVAMDLETLGYEVEIHNTRPSYSSIGDDEILICIRKDATTNEDYHLMRYFVSSGKWQHKPGDSVHLQFDGTMSNSVDWLCEGIIDSGYACAPYVYDSAIRYIIYRDPDYYEEENNSIPDIPEVDVVS